MNTPKDEMITEAIHCMVEQRKHEIWEVLYPLSIKYGFTLDSDYASIKLEPPCKDFPEEKCGCKILDKFNITQPTLSHHMKILVGCGLVNDRKEGKWHHYSLNKKVIREASSFIEALGR